MKKEQILNQLKQKNQKLLSHYQSCQDTKNAGKHLAIGDILNQKDAFNKIDSVIALNILFDILKDQNQALETYKSIIMSD